MAQGRKRATPLAVTRRTDLPVGDCVASVLEAEGAVQVIWGRFGPADELGTLMNDFATDRMAGELRALADVVEAAQTRREA
ncbi:hypothetical protein SAMN05877809_10724 [Rhodobacter sp. JA431]|uniref:hypothetical protein n=1 Tax=Rhodobacter sp. JA431 TaxID=570013 RepID=UPI000BC60DCD|nr:hypothetical protein [Rhodobacter sp. JA431]SOC13844.1 hypothetical protein SAMN05877809_10724 [Rhodobacter sp. JA431]